MIRIIFALAILLTSTQTHAAEPLKLTVKFASDDIIRSTSQQPENFALAAELKNTGTTAVDISTWSCSSDNWSLNSPVSDLQIYQPPCDKNFPSILTLQPGTTITRILEATIPKNNGQIKFRLAYTDSASKTKILSNEVSMAVSGPMLAPASEKPGLKLTVAPDKILTIANNEFYLTARITNRSGKKQKINFWSCTAINWKSNSVISVGDKSCRKNILNDKTLLEGEYYDTILAARMPKSAHDGTSFRLEFTDSNTKSPLYSNPITVFFSSDPQN